MARTLKADLTTFQSLLRQKGKIKAGKQMIHCWSRMPMHRRIVKGRKLFHTEIEALTGRTAEWQNGNGATILHTNFSSQVQTLFWCQNSHCSPHSLVSWFRESVFLWKFKLQDLLDHIWQVGVDSVKFLNPHFTIDACACICLEECRLISFSPWQREMREKIHWQPEEECQEALKPILCVPCATTEGHGMCWWQHSCDRCGPHHLFWGFLLCCWALP